MQKNLVGLCKKPLYSSAFLKKLSKYSLNFPLKKIFRHMSGQATGPLHEQPNQFFYNLYLVREIKDLSCFFSGHCLIDKLFLVLFLFRASFFFKKKNQLLSKKKNLKIKCTTGFAKQTACFTYFLFASTKKKKQQQKFNFLKNLKKKRTFFLIRFGYYVIELKKETFFWNSYFNLKKNNNNHSGNQIKSTNSVYWGCFLSSIEDKKQPVCSLVLPCKTKSFKTRSVLKVSNLAKKKNSFKIVGLQNLKTINFCLNKSLQNFLLLLCGCYAKGLKFKKIFNNFYTNNCIAMQTDKIHRNNFNHLSEYTFNFYKYNILKLHIKFFNKDFLYFQKKDFWCVLSAMKHFFNHKQKLTLILYFNNLTKIEQHFFLYRNYRKYFFWWVFLLLVTPTNFRFLGQTEIANSLFLVFCRKQKTTAATRSQKKASAHKAAKKQIFLETYLKTLTYLKKIKDLFFKYLYIRLKYLLIKKKRIFFKSYFFLIGSLRSSIPFINRQIFRFIYFLNFLQTFHYIQNILFFFATCSRNAKKKQNVLIDKTKKILKIDSYFFVCYFILKTKKTNFLIQDNNFKLAISFYSSKRKLVGIAHNKDTNNFNEFMNKNKYLAIQEKNYKNKDLQNLNFYLIFGGLHHKNKKIKKNFYNLIKNIFLERNYDFLDKKQGFVFSLRFLDNILFTFLFKWAKNQHKNNKNFWIFSNYWLFIQPFHYFYSNQTYFNFSGFVLQSKTKACGHNSQSTDQKNQDIYLIDKRPLLNYTLIKKLGCFFILKTKKIQSKIFLSKKIKKRINNKIEQRPKIIDKTEIVNIQFKKIFYFLLLVSTAKKKNKFQLLGAMQYFVNKNSKKLVAGFASCAHSLQALVLKSKTKEQITYFALPQNKKIKNQRLKKNLKTYYLDKYKIFFFPVKRNLIRAKTTYEIKKKKLKEVTFGTKFIIFKKILLDNFKTINLGLYLKNEEFSFLKN